MLFNRITSLVEAENPPSINHRCLNAIKGQQCHDCEQVCPVNAIALTSSHSINDNCINCGLCVQACKVQAIENINLPQRRFKNNRLVFDSQVLMSLSEIYTWSQEKPELVGVLISSALEEITDLLDKLNVILARQHQTLWDCEFEENVNLSKRRMFTFENNSHAYAAQLSPLQLRSIEQYEIQLDQNKCNNCHVCTRVCTQGALQVDNGQFEIDPAQCNGCNKCVVLCASHAIEIAHTTDTAEKQSITLHEHHCLQCQQAFLSHKPMSLCYICQQTTPNRMVE